MVNSPRVRNGKVQWRTLKVGFYDIVDTIRRTTSIGGTFRSPQTSLRLTAPSSPSNNSLQREALQSVETGKALHVTVRMVPIENKKPLSSVLRKCAADLDGRAYLEMGRHLESWHSFGEHHIGRRLDNTEAVDATSNSDRQAFPGELVDQRHEPELAAIMGSASSVSWIRARRRPCCSLAT